MIPSTIEAIGTGLFAAAILHVFVAGQFDRLARVHPSHAALWHLLGTVELVFGLWATVLIGLMIPLRGLHFAADYLGACRFTEPAFVFSIMVIAASRPVLYIAGEMVLKLAQMFPIRGAIGIYCVLLSFTPLLGSLITEPAAMTLAALLLRDMIYAHGISKRLRYATLGVLLVNVSIGGSLTPFAAPTVLMVAGKWNLSLSTMLGMIGWKAALAVLLNAIGATLLFWRELAALPRTRREIDRPPPALSVAIHLLFLAAVVVGAFHPLVFSGVFLLFLGTVRAWPQHHDRLLLRESLLVALFLSGLVVLGGQQHWWLRPLLADLSSGTVFIGTSLLTAVTDNATLTYLGSLVEGLPDDFKYALLTGAVTGGGLTIIANAPNPAGAAILREYFEDDAISPLALFASALLPTLVAAASFLLL